MSRIKRVTVMSPQTRLARARRRPSRRWRLPRLDAADTERALANYQAQRRIAVVSLVALASLLLGLPLVLTAWPQLDHVRVGDVPLSWLMLAAGPFPIMVLLAAWQLRRAERVEDRR